MIQFPVRDLCLYLSQLEAYFDRLEHYGIKGHSKKLSEVSDQSFAEEIKYVLESLEKLLEQCELSISLDGIRHARQTLASDPIISRFSQELGILQRTIS